MEISKRFSIAFSFAGEKRAFVAKVADILAKTLGRKRILYDEYHKAEFARADLAKYLPNLYYKDTELVVAVLCRDYEKKDWCGLEWNAIYGRLKKREVSEVMLCRFDRVEMDELFGLPGFLDLDDMTPDEAATHIIERLAINQDRPKNDDARDTQAGPDWPVAAPPLDWPVADHREAQAAFAQLITQAAPFRILLIQGKSDTGKSHLTKQFLGNALKKITYSTCGRCDFKGSPDMDNELRAFAERLGVSSSPTSGTGVIAQLGQVVADLKKAARPTLLVFDTFEKASESEGKWVKENLLLSVIRAPWLRIIIVGQHVPLKVGESWEDSAALIALNPPNPQDWFDFGKRHEPNITLKEVRRLHQLSRGKSSLLAQLLGPKN